MSNYGKTATVEYIGRLDDGTIFDSTQNIEPLSFEVGSGRVINGFDEAVSQMMPGETKTIKIPPSQAYGEYDDSKIEIQPMYAIPNAKDIKVGKLFYFITEEKLRFPAKVLEINQGFARIDFNHPLAGKNLNFEIKLLSLEA
jgi:peptidylprolyl isomerase